MSSSPKGASPSMTSYQSFRRACDRCHAQKLKCLERSETNRAKGCQRCHRARLECVYGQRTRFGHAEKRKSLLRSTSTAEANMCTIFTADTSVDNSNMTSQIYATEHFDRKLNFDSVANRSDSIAFASVNAAASKQCHAPMSATAPDYSQYDPAVSGLVVMQASGQNISRFPPFDVSVDIPSYPDFDIPDSDSGVTFDSSFDSFPSNGSIFPNEHPESLAYSFEDNHQVLSPTDNNTPLADQHTSLTISPPMPEQRNMDNIGGETHQGSMEQLSTLMRDLQKIKDNGMIHQSLRSEQPISFMNAQTENILLGSQTFSRILHTLVLPSRTFPETMTYHASQQPILPFDLLLASPRASPVIDSQVFCNSNIDTGSGLEQRTYGSTRGGENTSSTPSSSTRNSRISRTAPETNKHYRTADQTNPLKSDSSNHPTTPTATPSTENSIYSPHVDTATSLAVLTCYILLLQTHDFLFYRIHHQLQELQAEISTSQDLGVLQYIYNTTRQIHSISQQSILQLENIETLLHLPHQLRSTTPPPLLHTPNTVHQTVPIPAPPSNHPCTLSTPESRTPLGLGNTRDINTSLFPIEVFEVVIRRELLLVSQLRGGDDEGMALRRRMREVRRLVGCLMGV